MKEFEIDFNHHYLLEKGQYPIARPLEKGEMVILRDYGEEDLVCIAKVIKVIDNVSTLTFVEWID